MSVNHDELSEKIGMLYGVDHYILEFGGICQINKTITNEHFITQDIGAMMRLAIENFMYIGVAYCEFYNNDGQVFEVTERVELHDNDPVLATCVAIAKALIKLKGE